MVQRADSLFAQGQYQLAGIVYEEVSYLSVDNEIKAQALLSKADCYLAKQQYSKAQTVLTRIYYPELNDTLVYESRYKTTLAAYLNSDFNYAVSQVILATSLLSDSSLFIHIYPLYAMVLNEQHKWDSSKQVVLKYINFVEKDPILKLKYTQEIHSFYAAKKIPKLKSPEKAKMLSTFLPGTGQLYAGYFWEGAINVTLQLVGLGATAIGIYNKYYFTSAFVGFGLFQKFYAGGMNRSMFLANKRNYVMTRKFNAPIRDYLLNLAVIKKAP